MNERALGERGFGLLEILLAMLAGLTLLSILARLEYSALDSYHSANTVAWAKARAFFTKTHCTEISLTDLTFLKCKQGKFTSTYLIEAP